MSFARLCLLTTVVCALSAAAVPAIVSARAQTQDQTQIQTPAQAEAQAEAQAQAQAQAQIQAKSKTKGASSSASSAESVPQPPTTQDVTVVEPNMDALHPPKPETAGQPRWSHFPKSPTNVPGLSEFATRVHKEEGDKAMLAAIGASIVWERFQPDALAAAANAQLDPNKFKPIDPEMTPEQTEALAQSLRNQDTPPPVAQ